MPVLQRRFQDAVREAMGRKDPPWNQSELARAMGVGRMYVSSYLTGRHSPGLDVVEKFAKALGVDPGDLLASEKISA